MAPRLDWRIGVLAALGLLALMLGLMRWRPIVRAALNASGIDRVEGYADILREAGREADIDPNLLAAIMFAESSGRVDAVSEANALGLFQLMLPTARERAGVLGLPEPTREDLLSDARLSTRLGANYLAWLFDYLDGHLEKVLIAYNAGPGRLNRWIDEAGSYGAWRAERVAAGNSGVLAYAQKVQDMRELFAERGVVVASEDDAPQGQRGSGDGRFLPPPDGGR